MLQFVIINRTKTNQNNKQSSKLRCEVYNWRNFYLFIFNVIFPIFHRCNHTIRAREAHVHLDTEQSSLPTSLETHRLFHSLQHL